MKQGSTATRSTRRSFCAPAYGSARARTYRAPVRALSATLAGPQGPESKSRKQPHVQYRYLVTVVLAQIAPFLLSAEAGAIRRRQIAMEIRDDRPHRRCARGDQADRFADPQRLYRFFEDDIESR